MTEYTVVDGTFYDTRTPREVINALELSRRAGYRIRVWYGDAQTGAPWMEESDVTGYVSRTTGPVCIPLLVHNKRSLGAPAMLEHCIVRIVRADTRRTLYQHPTYRTPMLVCRPTPDGWAVARLEGAASTDHALFPTEQKARRWADFMTGERMNP